MNVLEKYHKNETLNRSEQIVINIMEDILDRNGIGNEWDNIDFDLKADILNGWVEIIDNL